MSKNRRLKKKMKNMMATVATLVLIVGVSVGITLALMATKTNEKKNTFTGSKGIEGGTYEEFWDGSTADDPEATPKVGQSNHYGYNDAQKYTPGQVINKNPKVSNLSEDEDVWVMMRVEYTITGKKTADGTDTKIPVTYAEFSKLARISSGDKVDTDTGLQENSGNAKEAIGAKWELYYVSGDSDLIDESAAQEKVLWTNSTKPNPDEKDFDENLQYCYKVNDENGKSGHIYYYYYYKEKLSKINSSTITSTTSLFDTIHINTQATDYNNIFLTPAAGGTGTGETAEERGYQINTECYTAYPDTYYTYSSLPSFDINIESAIVAYDSVNDPDTLGDDADSTKKKTVLANLKSVFDAYDSSRTN